MIKLLIVDDEKGITDTLKNFFEQRMFSVKAVNSAESALEAIKKDKPNTIPTNPASYPIAATETSIPPPKKVPIIENVSGKKPALFSATKY